MRVDDLRAFLQVVESGGFTAAGRALGQPTKTISRRVASLEAHLGVQLLVRTTRAVRLTPEGTRFFGDIRGVVDGLDAAVDGLAATSGARGRVRMQLPTLLATGGALAHVHRTLTTWPDLQLELVVRDRPGDLVKEGVDLAVHIGRPPDSGLVARRIGLLQVPLGAMPSYLQHHPPPQAPADLAHHACLRFVGPGGGDTWDLEHRETGERQSVSVGGRLVATDSRLLHDALVAGLGIGPLAAPATRLAGPQPLVVLPDWWFARVELFALMLPGRHRLSKVRAALAMLTDVVQDFEQERFTQQSPQ